MASRVEHQSRPQVMRSSVSKIVFDRRGLVDVSKEVSAERSEEAAQGNAHLTRPCVGSAKSWKSNPLRKDGPAKDSNRSYVVAATLEVTLARQAKESKEKVGRMAGTSRQETKRTREQSSSVVV